MNNRSSFKRIEHYDPNETLELVMNTSQSYLFEINGAQRTLSDTFALNGINLRMQPGEIIGFVGANGAGKTTVIRALLGLLHLDSGEIRLFGQPFGANAPDTVQRELRGRIGVVFDTCPLHCSHLPAMGCRRVRQSFARFRHQAKNEGEEPLARHEHEATACLCAFPRR